MSKILTKVAIGVPAKEHEGEDGKSHGITLAQIAKIHEFGSEEKGIPQRSHYRAGIKGGADQLKNACKNILDDYFTRRITKDQMREQFGLFQAGLVQQKIGSGLQPALKDATIMGRLYADSKFPRIKGVKNAKTLANRKEKRKQMFKETKFGKSTGEGAKPLIATGNYIQSITWGKIK